MSSEAILPPNCEGSLPSCADIVRMSGDRTSARKHVCDCIGKTCCPMGPKNSMRCFCRFFEACIDEFIIRRLEKGHNPRIILRELKAVVNGSVEPQYGASDYVLLIRIAAVARANGYQMGRKAVDGAILSSSISESVDPIAETIEIRRAFGTYGRNGAGYHRKKRAKKANRGAK